MRINSRAGSKDGAGAGNPLDLKEIVMGLHWQPPGQHPSAAREPANLDALCALLDAEGRVLEVVHPGHPSSANGGVIHTGDSRTGASEWDDERIFVFLEALPENVAALAFLVASVTGRSFKDVPGATCHVSDRLTERELVRLDLTGLADHTAYSAAAVCRSPAGWSVAPGAQAVCGKVLRALQLQAAGETDTGGGSSLKQSGQDRPEPWSPT